MIVSMHNHDYGGKLNREVTGLSKTHTSGPAYLSISPINFNKDVKSEIASLHSFMSDPQDKLLGGFFFGEGMKLLRITYQ
jgi:hypothetical protein